MGFFNKLFGSVDYPELDTNSPAAAKIDEIVEPLQSLMEQVKDPMEVIPAEDRTFVFIGKPPKRFGVAWIENGEVCNFQLLAKDQGVTGTEFQKVSDKLRDAYESNQDADRFKTSIAGREVVVTPCAALKQDVGEIVDTVLN